MIKEIVEKMDGTELAWTVISISVGVTICIFTLILKVL